MYYKLLNLFLFLAFTLTVEAQTPQPLRQFLNHKDLKGASVSLLVKDLRNNQIVYAYDTDRELIPASVMKLVTTATALEVLGKDFRFETTLEYDGEIKDGVLNGNLYIKGSGDPTLGSSHIVPENSSNKFQAQQQFIKQWIEAIKKAGIKEIKGSLIADDSVFDTEGVSLKWLYEDMGSYYGAGSYGISVFDNIYRINLKTGAIGSQPEITDCIPALPDLQFHNYLTVSKAATDSCYILGAPYSTERFLYGTVPANKEKYTLRGDIPDPALFLAQYVARSLQFEQIGIKGEITSYRLLTEKNKWAAQPRTKIISTYSPTLPEIIKIINQKSHNLYADAVLKVLGNLYDAKQGAISSSFSKGSSFISSYWQEKGFNTSSLWMFDGSGLAPTDKLTTGFISDILSYMYTQSADRDIYIESLPKVGVEGSVRNFMKGSSLQGQASLKSGSMSRVKAYAGYVQKEEKDYIVAIMVNNYNGEGRSMTKQIEQLLLSLF